MEIIVQTPHIDSCRGDASEIIQPNKGSRIESPKNKHVLRELSDRLVAELMAAYSTNSVDTWQFRSMEFEVLWPISMAVVLSEDLTTTKWLRYLLSEKVPRQLKYLQLILFLRTGNEALIPEKYSSDQVLASILHRKPLLKKGTRLLKLLYFPKPTRVQRKRGYGDHGSAPTVQQRSQRIIREEFEKSYQYQELLEQLEYFKEKSKLLEKMLVEEFMLSTDTLIPSVNDPES